MSSHGALEEFDRVWNAAFSGDTDAILELANPWLDATHREQWRRSYSGWSESELAIVFAGWLRNDQGQPERALQWYQRAFEGGLHRAGEDLSQELMTLNRLDEAFRTPCACLPRC